MLSRQQLKPTIRFIIGNKYLIGRPFPSSSMRKFSRAAKNQNYLFRVIIRIEPNSTLITAKVKLPLNYCNNQEKKSVSFRNQLIIPL